MTEASVFGLRSSVSVFGPAKNPELQSWQFVNCEL
jgi:hypothetical protein